MTIEFLFPLCCKDNLFFKSTRKMLRSCCVRRTETVTGGAFIKMKMTKKVESN